MKLVMALLIVCGNLFAATVSVPSEYPTIQSAVIASTANDTILIDAGVHSLPAATLVGYGPRAIIGAGMMQSKIVGNQTIDLVGGSIVHDLWKDGGFYIHDGFDGDIEFSGVRISNAFVGILIGCYGYPNCTPQSDDTIKVTRCIFENTQHYGIQCEDGHLVVEHCCFRNSGNTGSQDNAVWCARDQQGGTLTARIRNNSFFGGRTPYVYVDVAAVFRFNSFYQVTPLAPNQPDGQVDQAPVYGSPLFVGGVPYDYHTDAECLSVLIGSGDPSMPLDPDNSIADIGVHWNDCDPNFLPVELISFTATPGDGRVALNWSTGSESNVSHFQIGRDGVEVAHVEAVNRPTGNAYVWLDTDVTNGQSYSYTLTAVDFDGSRVVHGTVEATPRAVALPVVLTLAQNYPNPFNASTTIEFSLPEAEDISLRLFNLAGQEVAVLADGVHEAGRHAVQLNANDLSSGVYFYRLESAQRSIQQKMVLLK